MEEAVRTLKGLGAREVYLFGSVAIDRDEDGSDVDMAVVGLPPEVFFGAIGAAERILRRPLDLVDLDESNAFTRYLKEEGELVRVG